MNDAVPARVLDVGQCSPDHSSIRALLSSRFAVEVDRANLLTDALAAMRRNRYRLVLVNRVFDADGTEGLELIRQARQDETLRDVPIMMVSNYQDAQTAAQAAGGLAGFGKAQLFAASTVDLLAAFLPARETVK